MSSTAENTKKVTEKSTRQSKPKSKSKPKTKTKSPKVVLVPPSPPPPPAADREDEDKDEEEEEEESDDDDSDSDLDSENGGVDEKGMERLMKALGEDGLNEFDQAMLGEDESEDEDEEEEENEEKEETVEKLSDDDDEEEEEELVAVDDEDVELEPDAVPLQRLQVDNETALSRIRETIQLDPSLPWTETLVLSYPQKITVDVNDDLNRELAFYKQALHGANEAKTLASKHNFPFTRPPDYFAEMVKSDAHMERIRQKLLDESASIKKSEDKRREREGKKFGKQVQIEKMKEREKNKKDMEERLKGLKRKRKDILDNGGGEEFDVAVEDAIADRPVKRSRSAAAGGKKLPRHVRDRKFGFGGQGRRSKQNTKESTDNFDMGGPRRGGGRGGKPGGRGGRVGGGTKRPGKSRRVAARSKRV